MYFFKDVGEVVSVWLIVNHEGKHVGYAFVDFASAYQAKKALEKKNGEYLHGHQIFLEVAKTAPDPPRPKYCIDHKVWYEDYLRRESLLVKEDEAVDGLDCILDFIEEVAARKRTLFVNNIPFKAKISHIIKFFKDVGQVVRFRLIVDHRGEHVRCGFVEFASANEVEKALEKKKNGARLHGVKIFLDEAKLAPYPLRPKYNFAEKLWLKVESYLIVEEEEEELETKPNLKKQEVPMMGEFCSKKIIFSDDD
ncbi:nucleolin 1-like [Arabidopsis lyrata subsp. lyrata]|uniref:nucleolin 1-like n=1 Tax=Arabidopsis lyrata subsp. lyrata TaxID=81972 RepID=UPI000A29E9D5|nr:nucleolin 1-like [Arabidopsis lyrata subsp. lyrata]|eukprot:XP_020873039.1 nucleolin 1-like [Arabidopsis lyrata subsp. lyrata]